MADNIKSAVIAFLGNAYHDSRVVNLINSLNQINISTSTISFDWKSENFKPTSGKTSVYKLDKKNSSIGFYFKFFYLLIRDLLRYKADIYFAEDIYTLPVVYFFAKLNKSKIFYNSREIYAHLAGLRNKNFIQRIIARIEKTFIGKVDTVLVTGEMDAEFLRESYSIDNFFVLRNLPKYQEHLDKVDLRRKLGITDTEKIILYQGVLLEGRGLKKLIDIFGEIKNAHFVIVGDGEFRAEFESDAKKKPYGNKIHFLGAVPHAELLSYTAGADIGLTIIENISISYYYALPNKLFEYIMANIPVISSNLPQMKQVIDEFGVGIYVNPEANDEIINAVNQLLNNSEKLQFYQNNCKNAAKELNWDSEFKKFQEILLT